MRHTLTLLFVGALLPFGLRAAEVKLELTNGTSLVGTILKEENGKIQFRADLVGEVVIDTAAVAKRTPLEAVASTPPSTLPQEAPVMPPSAAAPITPIAPAGTAGAAGKVTWKRLLSFNGSYNSASYEQGRIPGIPASSPIQTGAEAGLQGKQTTMQATATLIRATAENAFTLQGTYGYADYQPAGAVMNNHSAEMTYTQIFSPEWYWLTRSTYKVDKVALIDHDFEQVFGVGRKLIDKPGTSLDLIPGLSFVNDKNGSRYDDRWITSVGFLENFEHAFSETVSVEQRFKYRVGVKDTDVWAINAFLGLKAQLTEHTSFNFGLTFTEDNTLGPLPATLVPLFVGAGLPPAVVAELRPAKREQLQVTSGLEYDW